MFVTGDASNLVKRSLKDTVQCIEDGRFYRWINLRILGEIETDSLMSSAGIQIDSKTRSGPTMSVPSTICVLIVKFLSLSAPLDSCLTLVDKYVTLSRTLTTVTSPPKLKFQSRYLTKLSMSLDSTIVEYH